MKNVLVLGGTHFLGRRFVERCLEQSEFRLTLFHRGKTNAGLFPECEEIFGDRETDDIETLKGRDWDAVVDFSAYYPDSLSRLLRLLNGHTERYVFISSLSVFSFEHAAEGVVYDESQPTLECSEEDRVDRSMMSYGARKAECERVLEQATWLSGVSLRPAIIYGKYDWTQRLYSWLYRLATREKILLPMGGRELISMTDLEDLCAMIRGAVDIVSPIGAYNCTTHDPVPYRAVLDLMARTLQRSPVYVEQGWDELETLGLHAGSDFPMLFGMDFRIANTAIVRDTGWKCRPLDRSIDEFCRLFDQSTLAAPSIGITNEREDEVLRTLNV